MKPAPFDYSAPQTLEEALSLLQEHGFDAKLLAGGQSLIPVMNFRLAQPAMLIDLNPVTELQYLQPTQEKGLRIGAMVRHREVEYSQDVAQLAPLLSEVMPFIAHPQIRNRGTIGGSLAHADPAAELPVIMTALDAQFRLRCKGGERWVSAQDFYQGLFTTALEDDEILVEIAIPALKARTGYAFQEFARRHGDYAQAGIAAVLTIDEAGVCSQARLVYLNLGEVPMIAHEAGAMLVGQKPLPELIEQAALFASQNEIEPTNDIHASAQYKRHLAYVLGKKTIQEAVRRAYE